MEYRAKAVLNAPFENIIAVLKDISGYRKWIYKCTQAIALEGNDDFSKLIYYAIGSSLEKWKSDLVLSARTLADMKNDKIIVTLKSIDDHAYQHPDLKVRSSRFRVTGFKGSWKLTALSRTLTMVSFTAYANPGEIVQESLINNLIQNICFNSLQGLRRTTERMNQSSSKTEALSFQHKALQYSSN